MEAEEVCSEFDNSLSANSEMRMNAERFIEEQISENADFYKILFNIFQTSTNINHMKQSLIYLSFIIKKNFQVIQNSLQQFSDQLYNIIINTTNPEFFKLEVEIIFQIVLKIREPWLSLLFFIKLYEENEDLTFFCVYLYISCFDNPEISKLYRDSFSEIDCELTLLGLQHENIEINILSTHHLASSTDTIELDQYNEHYKIIYEFAEKSINLGENYFIPFWCQIFKMPSKIIEPFFNLAKCFIDGKKLSQNQIMILVKILIKNWTFIDHDDLETVIGIYFNALSQIEDVEYGAIVFTNLSRIDFFQSYDLFKRNIKIFLEADDQIIRLKGNVLLYGFTQAFTNQIKNDISDFINTSLNIAQESIENINWTTGFILEYLEYNKLICEDEALLRDFIYQCFINCQNGTLNYDSYLICEKMGPNPIYFDKFIEALLTEKIQLENIPYALCLLINLYSPENNLTNKNYEPFVKYLIDLFDKYFKEFSRLYEAYVNIQEEEEEYESICNELYQCTVIYNSISNLVLLFSFSNPSEYSKNIESAINCFIDFFTNEYIRELGEKCNTNIMPDIKERFAQIFKINKIKMIDYLDYNKLKDGIDIDELMYILFEYYGDNFEAPDEFVDDFVEILNDFKNKNKKIDYQQKICQLHKVILPTSKWLFRFQDDEILNKYKILLSYLACLSVHSYKIFIGLTKILKKLVNPKRFNSEKYIQMCSSLNEMMTNFSEKILEKVEPYTYCQCFEGLANLMIFFIRMQNEYAPTFLTKYIFSFYENYPEISEINLLILFTKMIDLNFLFEIDSMKQVIDAIIKRENINLDVIPYLFNLITKITKIEQVNASKYFQFGIKTFEDVKDEPIFHDAKIYCAYFLLTCFNQDSENFKNVIDLLPNIFSVFPSVKIINDLFEEIKIFIDKNENSFSEEVYKLLISTLARYLSYQENAPFLFKFNINLHNELIDIFWKLLNKFEPERFEELLTEFLPEQPSSVQYILSLQKQ